MAKTDTNMDVQLEVHYTLHAVLHPKLRLDEPTVPLGYSFYPTKGPATVVATVD